MGHNRKGRYERRKAERDAKKAQHSADVGSLEDVFTFNNLFSAGKGCCKGVRWKNSTQRFEAHLFSGTAIRRKEILDGKWKPGKYNHFTIAERGKTRTIDAPRIQDRQIHKVYTQEVLLPLYQPSMIYNNGASLRGKGLHFSQKQLKEDLHYHFRKYGREGNIILLDFSKFFPTASHDVVLNRHKEYIADDALRKIGDDIVRSTPEDEGLPLGVETSQAEMIAYPTPLDNYIKCQLSIKGAGHYMDDYYIIVPPGRDAKKILRLVKEKAKSLELTVSVSKTRIIPLTKPFKFCKAKYTLTETGKVVVNGNRDSMKRARRKIKAFHNKIENGEMTYEDLWVATNSMFAYFEGYHDHGRVLRLRQLFYNIFGFSSENINEFRERNKKDEVYSSQEI